MKTNMSNSDRLTRTAVAAILIILYFNGIITGIVGILLMIFAIIFFITAIFGYCPIYTLFHIKSRTGKE